jgi:hypothetical protein
MMIGGPQSPSFLTTPTPDPSHLQQQLVGHHCIPIDRRQLTIRRGRQYQFQWSRDWIGVAVAYTNRYRLAAAIPEVRLCAR